MNTVKEYTGVRERLLNAADYLEEVRKDRKTGNIASVEFVPPKIGARGYGKFKVRYKTLVAVDL